MSVSSGAIFKWGNWLRQIQNKYRTSTLYSLWCYPITVTGLEMFTRDSCKENIGLDIDHLGSLTSGQKGDGGPNSTVRSQAVHMVISMEGWLKTDGIISSTLPYTYMHTHTLLASLRASSTEFSNCLTHLTTWAEIHLCFEGCHRLAYTNRDKWWKGFPKLTRCKAVLRMPWFGIKRKISQAGQVGVNIDLGQDSP